VEWVQAALQLFGEHGPWVIVGGAIATTGWLSAFVRALMKNVIHLSAQCEPRFQVLQERLQEKDTYIHQKDEKAERWERVALTNTETAARSAVVAEKAIETVTRTTDGRPG
jgi:hypothetical protein